MKKLNETNIYKKVKYNSYEEFEKLRDEFKSKLPEIIRKSKMDDWRYHDWFLKRWEFGVKRSNKFEIDKELNILTKGQNELWVEHITKIIDSAIRGLAYSISLVKNDTLEEPFYNEELCNKMITNMIINILFGIDENYSNGTHHELERLYVFVCRDCNKETDYYDICYDCQQKD
jgi:hypothetical protein